MDINIIENFLNLAFDATSITFGEYDREEKHKLLLEKMTRSLGFDYGEIWTLNDERTKLHKSDISVLNDLSIEGFSNYSNAVDFELDKGLPGITWAKRKSIWVDNVQLEDNFIRKEEAKKYGITTGVTMPIFIFDYLEAIFFLFSKKPKTKHEYLDRLLLNISRNLGYSLMQQELKNNLKLAQDKISALKEINLQTIDRILSIKDSYTLRHQKETAKLAAEIACRMGLAEKKVQNIYLAGTVHDIGKIAIPYEILNKPGRLLKEEYELVKRHSIIGYDIIKHFAFDEEVKRFVLEHHERIDGSGYPDQKHNKDLLLGSKILAVADTVEAMMSDRPYRKALSTDCIINELKKDCGIKLDKNVCEIAISILSGH